MKAGFILVLMSILSTAVLADYGHLPLCRAACVAAQNPIDVAEGWLLAEHGQDRDWQHLTPEQRRKLEKRRRQFESLSPREQERIKRAREHFRELPPEKRRQLREKWRHMTPGERREQRQKMKSRQRNTYQFMGTHRVAKTRHGYKNPGAAV